MMDDDDKEDMFVLLNEIEDNEENTLKEQKNGSNQQPNQELEAIESKLDELNLEDQIISTNDEVNYGNQIIDNETSNNNEQLNQAVDERLLSDENEEEEENDDKPINFKEEVESNDNINERALEKDEDEDEDIKIIKKPNNDKENGKTHNDNEKINEPAIQFDNNQSNLKEEPKVQIKESNIKQEKAKEEVKKDEEDVDIAMFLNCNLNINEEVQKNEKFHQNVKIYDNDNDKFLRSKRLFQKTDFEILSILGTGSYASVVKAQYQIHEMANSVKALKVMKKKDMEKEKKLHQIYLENEVLMDLEHPNLVGIEGSFELNDKIYIVLEYLSKGDFSDFLRINHPLHNDTATFYAAEIVSLLDYLRNKKIVHRDLKPENIMLDDNYHLKAIDFATAKIMDKTFNKKTMRFENNKLNANKGDEEKENNKDYDNNNEKEDDDDQQKDEEKDPIDDENDKKIEYRETRGHTFVGTAEYVSPEVLQDIPADYGSDLWSLGCMIYQMYTGRTPYSDKNDYLIFQKIKKNKVNYPSFIPEEARDLISKILVEDPAKRLGNGEIGSQNDMKTLKAHPFFSNIKFDQLKSTDVPYKNDFRLSMTKQSQNIANTSQEEDKIREEEQYKFREKTKTISTIKQAVLDKKSPWLHYNKRKVVLDSTPKIEYIEPKKNITKGVIYLNKNCKAEHIDLSVFDLITPKRTFRFKTHNESLVWVKTINDAIDKFSSGK